MEELADADAALADADDGPARGSADADDALARGLMLMMLSRGSRLMLMLPWREG